MQFSTFVLFYRNKEIELGAKCKCILGYFSVLTIVNYEQLQIERTTFTRIHFKLTNFLILYIKCKRT